MLVYIARVGRRGQDAAGGAGRSQLIKNLERQVEDTRIYPESHGSQRRALSKEVM